MVYGIECHSGSKQSIMLTGILVSASLAVVLAVLHCFLCPSLEKRTWYCDYSSELTKITSLQKKLGFRIFAFEELEQATKGFTDRGRLWTFDYGFVYAGVIDNDSPVAIEKIQYRNKKEISFLLKNIRTLSTLSHVNLLKFIGCSVDATSGTLFLVYAFCVNGSLQDHLQRKNNFELNWIDRVNIALGISKALSYLLIEVFPAIYHHDLSNGFFSQFLALQRQLNNRRAHHFNGFLISQMLGRCRKRSIQMQMKAFPE